MRADKTRSCPERSSSSPLISDLPHRESEPSITIQLRRSVIYPVKIIALCRETTLTSLPSRWGGNVISDRFENRAIHLGEIDTWISKINAPRTSIRYRKLIMTLSTPGTYFSPRAFCIGRLWKLLKGVSKLYTIHLSRVSRGRSNTSLSRSSTRTPVAFIIANGRENRTLRGRKKKQKASNVSDSSILHTNLGINTIFEI